MASTRNDQIKSFIEAMASLRRFFHSRKNFFMQKMQVTPQQAELLGLLTDLGDATVKDVAEAMAISSSAATQMIEGLAKTGYVLRSADKKDRRVVRISLTAAGKKQFEELKQKHFKYMQQALADLSEKEMEILAQLPTKMINQFKKLSNK